jgi:hypothetical protein
MKFVFLLLSLLLIGSCSSNNLIIEKENGEKYIIDKSNLKNQNYSINDLIDIVNRVENNKIKKTIEDQQNNKDVQSQINKNTLLKKKLAESQNLINNNCGQWYRPELCNKGMDSLGKDKELLVIGEEKLESIKRENELKIKNEREKKKAFINEIINENYAEIHFSKIIFNATLVDLNKKKIILPAKSVICLNPVLQERYLKLWEEYSNFEKTEKNFIENKVCEKLTNFE